MTWLQPLHSLRARPANATAAFQPAGDRVGADSRRRCPHDGGREPTTSSLTCPTSASASNGFRARARPCGVAWEAVTKQSWFDNLKAAASHRLHTQMQTHTRPRKRARAHARLRSRRLLTPTPQLAPVRTLTHTRARTHTNANARTRMRTHEVRTHAQAQTPANAHSHTRGRAETDAHAC